MNTSEIKKCSAEKIVNVLQTCSEVLMSYYQDTHEYGALLASQEAEDAQHYLMCEVLNNTNSVQIH